MIRRGLTLLEVMIAMCLFVIAMSMVLEGMIASRGLASHESAHDDVAIDASRVTAEIAQDLAISGWHTFDNTLPRAQPAERSEVYYPFIQLQDQGGFVGGRDGGQFQHTWRGPSSGAGVITDVWPGLPGQPSDRTTDWDQTDPVQRGRYAASFFARSQEIIFVRQITSTGWATDPRRMERPSENFKGTVAQWRDSIRGHTQLGVYYPSMWYDNRDAAGNLLGYVPRQLDPRYGVPILSAVLVNNDGTVAMQRLWEGQQPPDYTTIEPDTTTGALPVPPPAREYLYAVVPSPVGLGRLVRAYSTTDLTRPTGSDPGEQLSAAGGVAMVVDKVLSEDVVRVVFDTWRTDETLDVNDIRVRLYLARRQTSDPNLIVHRLVETIVQMRAKCAELDRAGDAVLTDIRGTAVGDAWRIDY